MTRASNGGPPETPLCRCCYCGALVDAPAFETEPPPCYDNDDAWKEIAFQHDPRCEWVQTRAHRIDTENAQ